MQIPSENENDSRIAEDRVVSVHEAATKAGISPATLKRCAARGEVQILKLSPRRVGIRLSRLNAWLDSRAASLILDRDSAGPPFPKVPAGEAPGLAQPLKPGADLIKSHPFAEDTTNDPLLHQTRASA